MWKGWRKMRFVRPILACGHKSWSWNLFCKKSPKLSLTNLKTRLTRQLYKKFGENFILRLLHWKMTIWPVSFKYVCLTRQVKKGPRSKLASINFQSDRDRFYSHQSLVFSSFFSKMWNNFWLIFVTFVYTQSTRMYWQKTKTRKPLCSTDKNLHQMNYFFAYSEENCFVQKHNYFSKAFSETLTH